MSLSRRSLHRRHGLIRRKKREALAALQALQRGEPWYSMSPEKYRNTLLDSLFAYELELVEIERKFWHSDEDDKLAESHWQFINLSARRDKIPPSQPVTVDARLQRTFLFEQYRAAWLEETIPAESGGRKK